MFDVMINFFSNVFQIPKQFQLVNWNFFFMFNIREGDLRFLMFRRKNQIHWRIKTVKYFLLYYCYSYFVRLIKRVCDSLSHVCRCCKQISPDVFLNNKLVFFYHYSILSMIGFACFLTVNIHVRDEKIFTSNISRRLHHFF
jgi:hypothetical protein